MFVNGEPESETEFSRIFKEGVAPCGASPFVVYRPRCGWEVASVYGAASCGVGDDGSFSEERGEEFEVWCFTAAGAGAGEFKERTEELYVFDCAGVEFASVGFGNFQEEVPVVSFRFANVHLCDHGKGFRCAALFGFDGAVVRAESAAGAVFGSYLYGVFFTFKGFPFGVG